MKSTPHIITLSLRQPAKRVYVLGAFTTPQRSLIPMSRVGADLWQLELNLPPGTYRFRYYVDDGQCIYCTPPTAQPRDQNGLDAVLTVPSDSLPANGFKRSLVPC